MPDAAPMSAEELGTLRAILSLHREGSGWAVRARDHLIENLFPGEKQRLCEQLRDRPLSSDLGKIATLVNDSRGIQRDSPYP